MGPGRDGPNWPGPLVPPRPAPAPGPAGRGRHSDRPGAGNFNHHEFVHIYSHQIKSRNSFDNEIFKGMRSM